MSEEWLACPSAGTHIVNGYEAGELVPMRPCRCPCNAKRYASMHTCLACPVPTMLAALEALAGHTEGFCKRSGCPGCTQVLEEARAAIAAARGEQ